MFPVNVLSWTNAELSVSRPPPSAPPVPIDLAVLVWNVLFTMNVEESS